MNDVKKYISYYLLVYLAVLAIFGLFQYWTICQGQTQNCSLNIDNVERILTMIAIIITPMVAIVGFLNWRTEKQYDLEKAHAEDLIQDLSKMKLDIDRKYHQLLPLRYIKEKFISINGLNNITLDLSRDLDVIEVKFETLNKISEHKIDSHQVHDLIIKSQLFKTAIEQVQSHYLHYYQALNQALKKHGGTHIEDLDTLKYPIDSEDLDNEDFSIKTNTIYDLLTNDKIKVECSDHLTKVIRQFEKTFYEYKQDYDAVFDLLISDLVKIIKPHQKTAS